MSKIGKKPIAVLPEVQVSLEGNTLKAVGSLGERSLVIPSAIKVSLEEKVIKLTRDSEEKKIKSLHGTYARLIQNLMIGVSKGFEKVLEIVGTGYRVVMEQDVLVLSLGYSHQIRFPSPQGIKLTVEENTKIKVSGMDKDLVGTTAHTIKKFRWPDSYKGKGVRYLGEKLRLKPGKAAAKAGATA